jgi:TP901 family phage tail tape measure protein
MSKRTIDTVIRLQNEEEYKRGLRNCTAELKVQKSELERVTSEYRHNANSMDALKAKAEVLTRTYETQQQKVGLLRGALEKAQSTRDAEEQTVSRLRGEYDAAKKTLAAFGEEVDKNSEEYKEQQAAVSKLRDEIIRHEANLKKASNSVTYYSTQLNKAVVDLNNLEDQQETNNRLMDEAKASADGCATSIDKYGDAVREAAEGTDKSTSAVEAMAGAMAATGIKETVDDLAASMMEASRAAQEFEHSVAQVGTIADEAVMDRAAISQNILALSTDLRKEANEVADAAYNALSAGVETANVLEFTAQSSKLATAGFTDTATSVDVLTTILNAYKMEATQTEKVASTLVKTQDLGKVTVDQMGKVMGRVIPSAAAYGVNLDNVAAAYANMTAAGINAENTTTYLGAMLDELANSGSNVSKVLATQTGKTFTELMNEGNSLADVLAIIGESVDNDQVKFSNLWSSATAGKAAISLFNGSATAFNATLEQMANSSGTVDKNYRKMIDTSEYSSKRLEVATKNLSIVVGSQLNPVLDEVREFGAGIIEGATEMIDKNPVLVSVIAGLTTGIGLLATGLSALMIVKSVTKAMQALNITLAANPVGLAAVGVAALVTAIGTFVAQSDEADEDFLKLIENSQRLAEAVETSRTAFEDSEASVIGAHDAVSGYIDQLASLEKAGTLTNVQQTEYQILLEKIRALMPELNIELDEQTGLIKGGANALLKQADAWKKAALQEAAYTRYKADIAAMAEAEYELAKNQALLNIERNNAIPIQEALTKAEEECSAAFKEYQDLNNASAADIHDYGTKLDAAREKWTQTAAAVENLSAELQANKDIQADLENAISVNKDAIEQHRDEVDAATEAYREMGQQVSDAGMALSSSAQSMETDTTEAIAAIRDAYSQMYADARTSIDKQIGLFDDLSDKCDMSINDMIKNLRSQKDAMENYADNLIAAVERGVDEGLVQQLADGSVESMQILAEIVAGTDKQIEAMNKAWSEKLDAADIMADTMAAVELASQEGVTKILPGMKTSGESLGGNLVDGLIAAIERKKSAYEKSIKDLADAGAKKYKEVNLINSPSKRYQKLAEYDVDGLVTQYRASEKRVEQATADVADAGYVSAIHARKAALRVMPIDAPVKSGQGTGQLLPILQRMAGNLEKLQYMRLDSGVIVGSTAGQYNQALGQIAFLTERGAT